MYKNSNRETLATLEDGKDLSALKKMQSMRLGIAGGMIGYLMAGAFISVLYFPQFWWLCTMAVVFGGCCKKLKQEAEQ
jgi:hypothetical protein